MADGLFVAITRISVGVDASQTSLDALKWSVGLATESGAQVRAVMAWEMPVLGGLSEVLTGLPSGESLSQECRRRLVGAIREARVDTDVEAVVVSGSAGPILAAESLGSDLLVLGRTGNGSGRVEQLILGSVARYCAYFARGHVAVVPRNARWNPAPTVVVGMDGSANSVDALRWAIEHLPQPSTILAVRAQSRSLGDITGLDPDSLRQVIAAARTELQGNIDDATTTIAAPVPTIIARVETGRAREVLLRPELGADLVVVGARGQTGVAASVLGSVADHVTRHAACPVVIVRPTT